MTTSRTTQLAGLTKTELALLQKAESYIERYMGCFLEVGGNLAMIQEKALYRNEYATFEQYLKGRWGYSKGFGYRMIRAHRDQEALAEYEVSPENPMVVDALARVPEQLVTDVWERAIELAPEVNGRPEVRARDVSAAHKEIRETSDDPFEELEWMELSEVHKEILQRCTEIKKGLTDLGEREHFAPVVQRALNDLANLRAVVRSNQPVGENDGKIITRIQERKE